MAPLNHVPQQITGTNYWTSNNVYLVTGAAFVMSNAVLNIENPAR